jgi:acetylornithine deacetylase/succinyl-diaminopimelate desuccinylase-like protein
MKASLSCFVFMAKALKDVGVKLTGDLILTFVVDERIVRLLRKNAELVLGKKPVLRGCGPTADGWFFIRRGIPAVCGFGPDGGNVHGADEWTDLESVKKATLIFTRTAIDYLES